MGIQGSQTIADSKDSCLKTRHQKHTVNISQTPRALTPRWTAWSVAFTPCHSFCASRITEVGCCSLEEPGSTGKLHLLPMCRRKTPVPAAFPSFSGSDKTRPFHPSFPGLPPDARVRRHMWDGADRPLSSQTSGSRWQSALPSHRTQWHPAATDHHLSAERLRVSPVSPGGGPAQGTRDMPNF